MRFPAATSRFKLLQKRQLLCICLFLPYTPADTATATAVANTRVPSNGENHIFTGFSGASVIRPAALAGLNKLYLQISSSTFAMQLLCGCYAASGKKLYKRSGCRFFGFLIPFERVPKGKTASFSSY